MLNAFESFIAVTSYIFKAVSTIDHFLVTCFIRLDQQIILTEFQLRNRGQAIGAPNL